MESKRRIVIVKDTIHLKGGESFKFDANTDYVFANKIVAEQVTPKGTKPYYRRDRY